MSDLDIQKISELRVVDLRAELEKRGLSKNGVKAELVERLMLAVQQGAPTVLNMSMTSNTTGNGKTNQHEGVQGGGAAAETDDVDDTHQDQHKEDNDSQPSSDHDQSANTSSERIGNESQESQDNLHNSPRDEDASSQLTESSEDLPKIRVSLSIFEESKLLEMKRNDVEVGNSRNAAVDEQGGSSNIEYEFTSKPTKLSSGEDSNIAACHSDQTIDASKSTGEDSNIAACHSDQTIDASKSTGDESKTGPSAPRETRTPRVSQDKKSERKSGPSPNSNVQTLVVTGFAASTRASDILEAFRCFGKIGGVKIISNSMSRAEGATRFAHVTISTKDNAVACIQTLDNSELHGSIISVSRVKEDALQFVKILNSHRRNSSEASAKTIVPAEDVKATTTVSAEEVKANATVSAEKVKASATVSTEEVRTTATASAEEKLPGENENSEVNLAASSESGEKLDKPETAKDESIERKKEAKVEKLEPKIVSAEKRIETTASRSRNDSKHRDDKYGKSSRDERSHHRPAPPHKRNVELRLRPHEGGRTYYTGGRSYQGPPYGPDRVERRISFDKIRTHRAEVVRRDYEREREERKRREEDERQRALARRNEIEKRKLDEERERLRRERDNVEREKQELYRLEKLRQQHERERIEKDKEEIRRVQLKLAQKRGLVVEKEHGRYGEYPEAKKPHVESHRVVLPSHSQPEFSRRSDPRHESSRRMESSRHDREGLRVEVDFDDRARARPREREHGHRSGSRGKHADSRDTRRDKAPEYDLPRAPKPPLISKPVERVSRDYSAHSSSSRAVPYRAPEAPVEPWARNAYTASSPQSGGRAAWANASSGRKPPTLVPNERQVRVEPVLDRWGTGNAPGYVNRASPSLLNQHVLNPHAGHMSMGGDLPGNNSGFSPYKAPPAQYRRY